jgi:hypothetical protein
LCTVRGRYLRERFRYHGLGELLGMCRRDLSVEPRGFVVRALPCGFDNKRGRCAGLLAVPTGGLPRHQRLFELCCMCGGKLRRSFGCRCLSELFTWLLRKHVRCGSVR